MPTAFIYLDQLENNTPKHDDILILKEGIELGKNKVQGPTCLCALFACFSRNWLRSWIFFLIKFHWIPFRLFHCEESKHFTSHSQPTVSFMFILYSPSERLKHTHWHNSVIKVLLSILNVKSLGGKSTAPSEGGQANMEDNGLSWKEWPGLSCLKLTLLNKIPEGKQIKKNKTEIFSIASLSHK